jgi:hypothetical protein
MPYINEEMKNRITAIRNASVEEQVDCLIDTIRNNFFDEAEFEGVCNYCISRIVAGVMKPNTGWRYKWLNRAYGTFLSAAAEFYRRVVAPYEDGCIEKNGDIEEYS